MNFLECRIYTPVVYWLGRCPFKAEKTDRNRSGVPVFFVYKLYMKMFSAEIIHVNTGKVSGSIPCPMVGIQF